jgi:hypothetical protein
MKTSLKTLLTTVTLAGAALLTGCATPNMQATFTRGDEVLYGRVTHAVKGNKMLEAHQTLCGTKYPGLKEMYFSKDIDQWMAQNNWCSPNNLDQLQQVKATIGVVNANGGMFNAGGYASKNLNIEEGDIVAIKVFFGPDGKQRRPGEVVKVAAKAKDATKENGCYWDAGTGVWSGFNQGGAVCEGWHWKNHPYSNPKLLKQ